MRVFDSRKLLTVGVLLLITTLGVQGTTSPEPAVVKDISFNSSGQSLEVTIAATQHAQYTYFELSKPDRLVMDFHGIKNAISFKERAIDVAGVERVRTSFYTDKARQATRIVFDLAHKIPFNVSDDGEGRVRVVFGKEGARAPESAPEIPTRAPLSLTAGPAMIPSAILAAAEAKPLPSVPVVSVPRFLPAFQAPQTPAPAALAAGAPQQSQYTGEILSFDLKDVDLKDFFRTLQDFSGLNIVLDPGVSGTIPLLGLNSVPWDQALDIVLKNFQLGMQLNGNVLRVATLTTLKTEEDNLKAIRDAREQNVPTDTRTFILNYTKTDVVSATLANVISGRGKIVADVRRNALIITDIPVQFDRIKAMIDFLDTPMQQVEIQARLLTANKSFSKELGNQLGFVLGNNSQNRVSGVGTVGSSPFPRNPTPGVNVGGSIPLVANFPAAGTSGLSFLFGAGADILLDEIITAAEARGTAKLLSRPSVMTQNNQAATISQGTKIPVQTNQNNTISVQFLDFSLKLNVTPQITDAGTILLNVNIENSAPDFAKAVNGIPSVSTQSAVTQVLVPDGGTAVIGGILVDTDSFNQRQVPGLGSIPLIGHLFKNTQMIKLTSELFFFITPRIKSPDALVVPPPEVKPPGR